MVTREGTKEEAVSCSWLHRGVPHLRLGPFKYEELRRSGPWVGLVRELASQGELEGVQARVRREEGGRCTRVAGAEGGPPADDPDLVPDWPVPGGRHAPQN